MLCDANKVVTDPSVASIKFPISEIKYLLGVKCRRVKFHYPGIVANAREYGNLVKTKGNFPTFHYILMPPSRDVEL